MSLSRSWRAFGPCLLLALSSCVRAVPSVDVSLRAAFAAPPYLVELLETAAEENATSYFPILDCIANGYFDNASTDQELYSTFVALVKQDGHLGNEDLSSFNLALSIHSAAPRVEAHYQFYNTAVRPELIHDEDEEPQGAWSYSPSLGLAHLSPDLEVERARSFGDVKEELRKLPYDRVLGDPAHPHPMVLYADILSPLFRDFHKTISKLAEVGKTSYRLRYIPSPSIDARPLTVSGYGVELALKRTDYIVIDDRPAGEEHNSQSSDSEITLSDEEVADLRPLSTSELHRLAVKTASFIAGSDEPMDMLTRLAQDFPKYSSSIAGMNVSDHFWKEHIFNRRSGFPPGYNALWINGVQIMPREVNAYDLLEHLRRERKMINNVRGLGLSAPDAIGLLSHEAIISSQTSKDVPRYDWRDEHEGGNVIVWMNDIEKDKRYEEWPETVGALLQRTFPGQLPPVRKDIHNIVMSVDLSSFQDAILVVETLQTLVKRKIPLRFGIVPRVSSPESEQQARIFYYLQDSYGLASALQYLGLCLETAGRKYGPSQDTALRKATFRKELKTGRTELTMPEVFEDEEISNRLAATRAYIGRLALGQDDAPILVNGASIPKSDDWLTPASQRLGADLQMVQQAVYTSTLDDDSYIPDLFLSKASHSRMPIIIPEDDKKLRHLDLGNFPEILDLPRIAANPDTIEREFLQLTVVDDVDSIEGFIQLMEVLHFQRQHDNVEVAWLHTPDQSTTQLDYEDAPNAAYMQEILATFDAMAEADGVDVAQLSHHEQRLMIYEKLFNGLSDASSPERRERLLTQFAPFRAIKDNLGLQAGQRALIASGRIVGPIHNHIILSTDDLETLLQYERKQRLLPASLAIQDLGLTDKATEPFSFAKISNMIARSLVSEVPEGIYEAGPAIRGNMWDKWNSTYTAVVAGERETSTIQIVSSIDPASETAQRWLPIIKTLSELDGVYTRVFLNPRERLDELPIKRFYRQVLASKPSFNENGSLQGMAARFNGMPGDALLNMGMDLPPSWLVAPKESIHDLDNIKLSAVKSGADIEAIYELEHILIEGHSTEVSLEQPPRGAQLVLRTAKEPHFADTIIMANIGYFQFKANPGVYELAMQEGRSEEIFNLDSAGTLDAKGSLDENTTEIVMTSFRGSTLFPSLSRKPNMEDEDVLEPPKSPLDNLANSANKLLAQAGLSSGGYLSKAAKLGNSILANGGKFGDVEKESHAEINIFSVASGHLYERMLNIMMVSVMKHTKHTVKFWFIEQFLSPSFKGFLPTLAEEYGFRYEMVTYKWPHWLRGQKEKQREIWGYKILFLDVLFPLDLDKVIFVDADQIVRTDMFDLVQHDLEGAPYGFTPMCDSRVEMEGFRFWKQGYWKNFLGDKPYHISALYVVDLKEFRRIAAGDRLRQQYHALSADPNSLANLDQDLPNHMQSILPIHSLPQDWLWCETWCSDEALRTAKTIDLCNNPQTKEPKLDRARRQVPEWTVYDDEIAAVVKRYKERMTQGQLRAEDASDAGVQGEEEESIQERLQREDAERERVANAIKRDEL